MDNVHIWVNGKCAYMGKNLVQPRLTGNREECFQADQRERDSSFNPSDPVCKFCIKSGLYGIRVKVQKNSCGFT